MRTKYVCNKCNQRKCTIIVESERDHGLPDCCPYDDMVETKWEKK